MDLNKDLGLWPELGAISVEIPKLQKVSEKEVIARDLYHRANIARLEVIKLKQQFDKKHSRNFRKQQLATLEDIHILSKVSFVRLSHFKDKEKKFKHCFYNEFVREFDLKCDF
ncbi:hypothetical protein M3Y97_00030300 [Aphelenchoides bicaudatus]|nr:hypothetical protein M3Y97_00030300 [Aphelenchoides bicaudatus]